MPKSSNPQELMRLLSMRHIQEGNKLRWVPSNSDSLTDFRQAFDIIGWGQGREPAEPLGSLPSEVVGLTARTTATTGELFVEWRTFDEEAVSSYAVRLTDSTGERTFVTTETTMTLAGLPLGAKYRVDVWATNQFGSGKKTSAEVILPNLRLGEPTDNFFQLNQHLLPTDQVDATGAAIVSETSPWGGSLAFPQVSYEAIMAATPEQPADVPALTLPTEIISEVNLEDGFTVSMWVQARSPGMLLSSDYTTRDGATVTVPYIWIGSNGVVNAGLYGPATGVTYGAEEEALLSGQSIFSTISAGGLQQIGSPQAIQGQKNVIDGTWHQITFVADKGSQALYVDGHLQGTSQAAQYGVFRSQASDWIRVNNKYVCTIPLEDVQASTLTSPKQLLLQVFQGEEASGSGQMPALGTNTYSGSGLIPVPLYPTYQLSLQGTNPVGFPGGGPTVLSSAEIELTNGGDYVLKVTAANQPTATNPITFSYQYMTKDATSFAVVPDVEWLIPTPDSVSMGGSIFPLSRTNPAPQTNYPQPYLGKVAELGFWSEVLTEFDFQALATAPLGVVIGANAGGHEYPNGFPIQQIAAPEYAFTFQNGVGDTFANISPAGGAGVAVASALTQEQTATIPLPFIGVERLPNHQSFGLGLLAPLASGHISLAPTATKEMQVALAAGDQLYITRGNTNTSSVLYVSIVDDLGNQIADKVPLLSSNSTVTELTKFTLTANRTGSFKITLSSSGLGNGNPLTFNYNMLPGPYNTWQSLFLSYRDPFTESSVLANYADPLIPQINRNSNAVVGAETATGAANYFPLWSDSRYFPDTGDYTAEDLSIAYAALQAEVGYDIADLNGPVYHSPSQLAASLQEAYDKIVSSPPGGINLAAVAAVNQFFVRVNAARQVVVDALGDFGDALNGMPASYSTAESIGRTISTNQGKFVVSTTAGSAVPNPVDPEHTNPFDIFDSVTREYLGTGLKYVINAGLSLVPGGSYATSLVNPVVKEIEGLIWPTTPKFTTKQNSVLVSYLPPMNAQLAYSTLEELGSRIDQNQADVLAHQKAQLVDPVFLNSVFSNWGLLELMENMDGSVYRNGETIQGMTNGVNKLLEGVAWKTMVPAMFSWDEVGAGDWPVKSFPFQEVNADQYYWQQTTPNVPDTDGVDNNSGGSWLAIGDLNGDDYPDVVTSNFYHSGKTLAPGTLSVLLGKPSLESNPNYPAAGYQATNAAANGGGGWTYTDLTEYSSTFRTKMAENLSNSAKRKEKNDQPRGIALGDFDGDGLDEAIVASGYGDVAWWYDISAPGTPGTTPNKAGSGTIDLAGLQGPQGVVASDFNQDGWEDFAVAGEDTQSVAVGINRKSSGEFSFDVTNIGLDGSAAYYITSGDLNGDTFPDLVVSGSKNLRRGSEGCVAVLMNRGNSSDGVWQGFELSQKWTIGTNYASQVNPSSFYFGNLTNPAIGDFTKDGIPDIAFGVNMYSIDPETDAGLDYGRLSVIAGSVGPNGWSGSNTLSPSSLNLIDGNTSPYISSVAAPGLIFTVEDSTQRKV
ncbi:MAG: FG-GAP-like repeat-containing protein [Oceanobacter sp.]